ncbi:ferredoxin [Streptomyces sp. NPDC051976]|uniref:ferredoxin n=1 Tax=Streptomyces sp. NPDC051976 TaxID=3154947 RepID=UPI003436355C
MTADRWHVDVDRSVCIGSGLCAGSAPGAFVLDGVPRQSRPVDRDAVAAESLLAAAESCPVEAITLTVHGSGEPVFPPEE